MLDSQASDLILLTKQQLVDVARAVGRASADEAAEKVLTSLQAEGRLKPHEVTTIPIGNGGSELTLFRRFRFDPRLLSFTASAGYRPSFETVGDNCRP